MKVLTKEELKQIMEEHFRGEYKDPVCSINRVTRKVSVLGERIDAPVMQVSVQEKRENWK